MTSRAQSEQQQHDRDRRGADSLPFSICWRMKTEATWVGEVARRAGPNRTRRSRGRRPARCRRGHRAQVGRMMRRKIVRLPAPSEAAASSMSWSSSISSGCTARTTNGRVTKRRAMTTAMRVRRRAERPVRAVEGEQRDAGDDRRQRERQVDQGVDVVLPGNSSRTRTQAMIVPKNALIATTISEADQGQLQRVDRLRLRSPGSQKCAEAAAQRLARQRRQRQQDEEAEVEDDRGHGRGRPRPRAGGCLPGVCRLSLRLPGAPRRSA